jgi:hypothetical protein
MAGRVAPQRMNRSADRFSVFHRISVRRNAARQDTVQIDARVKQQGRRK